MSSFTKVILICALLLMVFSCATSVVNIPEKYMLSSQLERVDEIADIKAGRPRPAFSDFIESDEDATSIMKRRDTVTLNENNFEWVKVDNQSFAIRAIDNEYHLLVLDRPAPSLLTTNIISFELLPRSLKAGTDYVDLGSQKYLIERIYKIKSTDQFNTIKNQILSQP